MILAVKPSFRAAKEQVVEGYKVIRDGAKKRFAREPAAPRAPRAPRPPSLAAFKAGLKAKIIELARHEGTRDVKAGPNGLTLHIAHESVAAAGDARESLLKLVGDHQDALGKAGWGADVTDFPHPDGRPGPFHHSTITFSGSKSTPLGRLFRQDAAGLVTKLSDVARRELVRKARGGAKPQAAPAKPPAPAAAPAKPPVSVPKGSAPAPAVPSAPKGLASTPGSPAKPPATLGSSSRPPAAPSGSASKPPAPAPAPKPPASPGSPSRPPAPSSVPPASTPRPPASAGAGHGPTTPTVPSTPAPSGGSASSKGIHFAPVINVTGGNPIANTGSNANFATGYKSRIYVGSQPDSTPQKKGKGTGPKGGSTQPG